jgi:hypothetical protein
LQMSIERMMKNRQFSYWHLKYHAAIFSNLIRCLSQPITVFLKLQFSKN